METKEFSRKMTAANNGFLHLAINIVMLVVFVLAIIKMASLPIMGTADNPTGWIALPIICGCLFFFIYILHCVGFMTIQPNQSRVMTFFGKYSGTVTDTGFFWVNPFFGKKRLSLRARSLVIVGL